MHPWLLHSASAATVDGQRFFPFGQTRGSRIGALEEIEGRLLGVSGEAKVPVGQDELADPRVVSRRVGRNRRVLEAGRLRVSVGIEARLADQGSRGGCVSRP